jgi:predicted small integral membrane protein
MYSTALLFRIAKAIFVAAIGLMALAVAIGNTTDYYSNYLFMEHVLKMDTTFQNSSLHYRSINEPILFHAVYIVIIVMETGMAFCCLKGGWLLFRNLRKDAQSFHAAKNWGIAGITIGVIIWFLGFEVIGGEWFAMWQSSTWNGLAAAERILSFLMLTLIFLHFREEQAES